MLLCTCHTRKCSTAVVLGAAVGEDPWNRLSSSSITWQCSHPCKQQKRTYFRLFRRVLTFYTLSETSNAAASWFLRYSTLWGFSRLVSQSEVKTMIDDGSARKSDIATGAATSDSGASPGKR